MSPILDRIVRTDCGARQCTDQSWTSDPVAGRGPGQAQSAQESVVSAHSVLSSGLETSVPWSKLMVKDVRQLSLNLDTTETSCLGLDDSLSWGQLAISSPQLGGVFRSRPVWSGPSVYRAVPMVRVGRRDQVRSWLNQAMRQRPGGVGFRVGTARGAVWAVMGAVLSGFGRKEFDRGKQGVMDTRQREKEKEKDLATGERTPKVQTWTVVSERNCEDSSRGKMCGDWVFVDRCEGTKRKSNKGKEAAGASGNVEAVGVENVGDQRDQDQGEQGETSHTEEQVGLNPTGAAVDDETGPDVEVAEPSIKDVLEAMKLMGAQMVTLTQAFTPLVNSSVGQVLPTQLGTVNTEVGLPQGPILPTEVQVENVGDQRDQDQGEQGETSHTEEQVGLNPTGAAVDDETGPDVEVAEPSIKDVLEAMKLMGAQMVTLTQAFTPLVNSSVGQWNWW
ncbi:hypothetical protein DY000_02012771 [Brassica cretica]|uniref:DOG1 domain-containing protein n=1 Tax=Brassica cretica TaxID=69181 RepID=A0ABQ7DAW4_BRACR|nr:hypothetical protein DY000_02012771 [Brassica cretica]